MAVKVYISIVILQFILECQCSECRWGIAILPTQLTKLVTTATSLERVVTNIRSFIYEHSSTNPENLVRIVAPGDTSAGGGSIPESARFQTSLQQ